MLEIAVEKSGPSISLPIVWGSVNGMRRMVLSKKVRESMMNAASTPYNSTTTPPSIAPIHNAEDHDAASRAFAVARFSSDTMFGSAARSAVTYAPCRSIINPESPSIHPMSSGPFTPRKHKARKIWMKFEAIMMCLRFIRSANRPLIG